MGLHTGQAVASDGRYTGLAVHRAARIGAAGHGGQILVSQATQTLLEDEEEDLHVFLRDLGEQRLKDLDRPVRLYQAAATDCKPRFRRFAAMPTSRRPRRPRSLRRSGGADDWRCSGRWRLPARLRSRPLLLLRGGSSGGLGEIQPTTSG